MGSTAPAAEVETGRIRPGAAHRPRAVALVLEGVALVEEAGGTSPRCYASSAESMATLPTSVPTPIGRATAEAWTSAETAEGEGEGQRHIEGSPGHVFVETTACMLHAIVVIPLMFSANVQAKHTIIVTAVPRYPGTDGERFGNHTRVNCPRTCVRFYRHAEAVADSACHRQSSSGAAAAASPVAATLPDTDSQNILTQRGIS